MVTRNIYQVGILMILEEKSNNVLQGTLGALFKIANFVSEWKQRNTQPKYIKTCKKLS